MIKKHITTQNANWPFFKIVKSKYTLLRGLPFIFSWFIFVITSNTIFAQPQVENGDCGRNILEFDGVDDQVDVSISDFNNSSGTIEAWVRKDNWQDAVDDALFSNGISHNLSNSFYLSFHPVVGLHFRYGGGADAGNTATYDDIASTNSLIANSWHHIAGTWHNNGTQTTLSIYMDGALVATTSTSTNLVIDAGTAFGISKGASGSHYVLQGGSIAEMRVWDVARTASEISDNKDILLSGSESGLISYWQLNDASGTTTPANLVGGGSTATLQNMDASTDWVNVPLEIAVADTVVLSGGVTDFGTVLSGTSNTITYAITNNGSSSLDLLGSPITTITGTNSDQFTLDLTSTASTLAAGASTTFSVGFNPTSIGLKEAAIEFTNTESCTDPYRINLQGYGGVGTLGYSGLGFTESLANDGAVTGSISIALSGDTFQDSDNDNLLDVGSEITVYNIPEGLTPILTLNSTTEAVLTLSGAATNHLNLYDIDDITFTFDNAAFVTNPAAAIVNATGQASGGLGINFFDILPSISYSGADFNETATNNGSVTGSMSITLTEDTFQDIDADDLLDAGSEYTINNVSAGLNPTLSIIHNTHAGQSWTSQQTKENQYWKSIAYGNELFVAVSNSGSRNQVMTSPNGIEWTHRAVPSGSWNSITYGAGRFVVVGDDYNSGANRVMTSPDGINWTAGNVPVPNHWTAVTYGNGLFVAVANWTGTNEVMTSPDGVNWTTRTSASLQNWKSITYGNGMFVAVGSGANTDYVMTSPDGISWTLRTAAASRSWISVTYGNGVFVAISTSYSSNQMMTSSDGITWASNQVAVDYSSLTSITFGNGLFVAVSNDGVDKVLFSSDGINWTAATGSQYGNWSAVTYGNGLFVAVDDSYSTKVMVSGAVAKLTFSGSAANHQDSDNLNDLQFSFDNSAFSNTSANSVFNATGPASSNIALNFIDNTGTISFGDAGFTEAAANEGDVSGSITMSLSGDTFQDEDADNLLDIGTEVIFSNIPEGLTPVLALTSPTEAVLTLTGNATLHQNSDDITDITVTFLDVAFTTSNAAAVANATGPANTERGVDFIDNTVSITYDGDGFRESSLNNGAVSGSVIITLSGDSFEDSNGNNQLEVGSEVTFSNP